MKTHITHRTQFPGITEHARKLGCSRPHLWQVLTGRRQSARLRKRYEQLMRAERAA